MSAVSATTSAIRSKRNSSPCVTDEPLLHAAAQRKAGMTRLLAQYTTAPKYALVVDHPRAKSREAHVFSTIEAVVTFEYSGSNARIVRIPGDVVFSERGIWEHIDRADRLQKSIPLR